MGEDTDGLRRDIQDTRGELTRDVDALTEKVRPSRILDRGVQRTRDRMSDMKDRVMGGAEDAAGSVREGVSSAGETVTDTASDAAVAALLQETYGTDVDTLWNEYQAAIQ